NAPAGLVAVKEERGHAASWLVRRAGDENEMLGNPGAGDEPFVAVDGPAIVLSLRPREHHAGVRTRAWRRLRHSEGGAYFSIHDGPQPFFFLRRTPGPREQ